jgi:hypothetical protein
MPKPIKTRNVFDMADGGKGEKYKNREGEN